MFCNKLKVRLDGAASIAKQSCDINVCVRYSLCNLHRSTLCTYEHRTEGFTSNERRDARALATCPLPLRVAYLCIGSWLGRLIEKLCPPGLLIRISIIRQMDPCRYFLITPRSQRVGQGREYEIGSNFPRLKLPWNFEESGIN